MSVFFSTSGHVRTFAILGLGVLLSGCSKEFSASPCDTEGIRLIAFSSNRSASQYDIFLYDADGAGFRLLKDLNSSTAADSSPALTSDGLTLAFVSQRGATGTDILLYNRASCTVGTVPAMSTTFNERQPTFSGDGLRLTFVRDTVVGAFVRPRIRLLNSGTLRLVPLPLLDARTSADWSPAPDRTAAVIAFVSDSTGNPDIYLYDRGGDTLIALPGLNSAAADLDPSLTPDSRYLCFASDRAGGAGGFDLYLYDLSTRTLVTPLANLNSAADDRHPSINPSGAAFAFQSDRVTAGEWDVFYYYRSGSVLANPAGLVGSADDLQPSMRFP
jgi:Tol biopolymer transport system component